MSIHDVIRRDNYSNSSNYSCDNDDVNKQECVGVNVKVVCCEKNNNNNSNVSDEKKMIKIHYKKIR